MLQHFENQSCPGAAQLLEKEAINYSVLSKILQGTCAHIFTDLRSVIVCHSCAPYPVWIWCADVENARSVEKIARCIKQMLPLEQGYTHILSRELLEQLQRKDPYFDKVKEKMGLMSYRLDEIREISHPCEGSMSLVREEEVSGLIGIWHDMHMEMEGLDHTPEHCEQTLRRMTGERSLFAWRIGSGEIVALTARGDQTPYSKITSVYTLPRHRRNGYAINLVHGVTKTILEDHLIPILYTDAGYAASNACYQKIGYDLVGRLISICR